MMHCTPCAGRLNSDARACVSLTHATETQSLQLFQSTGNDGMDGCLVELFIIPFKQLLMPDVPLLLFLLNI